MRILPREEKFFELLNKQTRLLTEAAAILGLVDLQSFERG